MLKASSHPLRGAQWLQAAAPESLVVVRIALVVLISILISHPSAEPV